MATPPSSRCICHRRLSYKQMVQDVADDMGTEDVQKIVFQFDLPADYKSKSALAALRELEVRGKFSDSDISPLLGLLQSIHRYDLINKHVTPYQQRFSLRCGCGRRGEAVIRQTVGSCISTHANYLSILQSLYRSLCTSICMVVCVFCLLCDCPTKA